jgi:hypothetical protein
MFFSDLPKKRPTKAEARRLFCEQVDAAANLAFDCFVSAAELSELLTKAADQWRARWSVTAKL